MSVVDHDCFKSNKSRLKLASFRSFDQLWSVAKSEFLFCSEFLFDVGCRRHHLSRRRVIPLPKMKANPVTHPQALFQTDQVKYSIRGPWS